MVFAKISQVAHYVPDQVVQGSYDVTFQEMRRLAIWQQWWHKDCWQKQI